MLVGKNEVQKGLKDVQTQTKQVEKGFVSLGGIVRSLGPIATAFGAAFSFKQAINEAIESEKAVRKLNIAMAQTGEFTLEASEQMQALADSLQKTSEFEDDVIIGQLALAKAFGQTNDQAQKTVKTAVDLSAAMGISLESAVQLLNKGFSGQLGMLSKIIPETKNLSKEMLQSGSHVDLIAKKFDGFAQKSLGTVGGQLNQISKDFGSLLEEFGKLITGSDFVVESLGKISEALRFLTGLIPKAKDGFTSFVDLLNKTVQSQLDLINPSLIVNEGLKEQGFIIKESAKNVDLAKSSTDRFNTSLLKMSDNIKKVGDAVKEVTVTGVWGNADLRIFDEQNMAKGLSVMQQVKKEIEDAIKTATNADFQKVGQVVSGIAQGRAGVSQVISGSAAGLADAIIPGSGQVVGPLIQLLGMSSQQMKEAIRSFIDGASEFILNIIENIPLLIDELLRGVPRLIDGILRGLPRVIQSLIESVPTLINSIISYWPSIVSSFIQHIPSIVSSFITSFINAIPSIVTGFIVELPRLLPEIVKGLADGIVKAIVDGIKDAFKKLNPLSGGGGIIGDVIGGATDFISGIGDSFGFSHGGIVPGSGNIDSVPIMATPGERVLTVRQNELLEQMLSQMARGGSNSGQGPIQITLQIGSRELSKVLLDINRSNMRLA